MPVTLDKLAHLPELTNEQTGAHKNIRPVEHAELKCDDNVFAHLYYVAGTYKNSSGKPFLVCSGEKVHETGLISAGLTALENIEEYKTIWYYY